MRVGVKESIHQDLLEIRKIADVTRARIGFSDQRDLEFIIVSVPVRIVAQAVGALVPRVAELRIMQSMCRVEVHASRHNRRALQGAHGRLGTRRLTAGMRRGHRHDRDATTFAASLQASSAPPTGGSRTNEEPIAARVAHQRTMRHAPHINLVVRRVGADDESPASGGRRDGIATPGLAVAARIV